ncbi:MAG TPA: LpqB family beta-propeller domain-containing protein, partial [Verrucomicrobiae bacterium]|nr:LpqB family beta-propeller domain-containing protein [Verrucomicrobiae bacterium]
MKSRKFKSSLIALTASVLLLSFSLQAGEPAEGTLARDAMRLLHANCLSCHNSEKHKGGLQMSTREALEKGSDSGPVLEAGHPDQSLLLKVLAADSDPHMPPKKQLSTNQMTLLGRWVAAGAPWDSEALNKAAAPRLVKLELTPPAYHPVMALALSPDGARLAIGRGSSILVYDLTSTNKETPGRLLSKTEGHADIVRALSWNPEGTLLASGGFRELKLWTVSSNALTLKWSLSSNLLGRISVVRFTPHGGALIVADGALAENGWVRVHAVNTGVEISSWQTGADALYDLSISPDGGLL